MKPRRISLTDGRELVLDRANGLTVVWIWHRAHDRCSSGPLVLRDGDLALFRRALAALGEDRPS